MEAEFLDTTAEFLTGLDRIMHRQTGKGPHTILVVLDLTSNSSVGFRGYTLGFGLIRDALDIGDGQRNNGITDALFVGESETFVVDIVNLAHVARAIIGCNVEESLALGLFFQTGALVGFFENDLADNFGGVDSWKYGYVLNGNL